MSEWQPIETAPKDEIILLAWEGGRWPGWWEKAETLKPGYWRVDGRRVNPTHWMSLPPSPDALERMEKERDRQQREHHAQIAAAQALINSTAADLAEAERQYRALQARIRVLEGALEPFAKIELGPLPHDDGRWVAKTIYCNDQVTAASVKRARAALIKDKGEEDGFLESSSDHQRVCSQR